MNISQDVRYPILGGSLQRSGGSNRHDAVVWAFARAAHQLGVDIVQQCEVTGFKIERGQITGLSTTKGDIKTPKVASVVAGHSSVMAKMADIKLPIESHPLQALVSEPVKPIMPCVLMSNQVDVYVSQSDKGGMVIGAGIDPYCSYSQRGGFNIIEEQMAAVMELFPMMSRLRMVRQWGGIVDVCPDASPLITLSLIHI